MGVLSSEPWCPQCIEYHGFYESYQIEFKRYTELVFEGSKYGYQNCNQKLRFQIKKSDLKNE